MQGKGADLEILPPNLDEPIQHTHGYGTSGRHVWTQNGKSSGNFPTMQSFAEHNGNEARQSLHYMAKVRFSVSPEAAHHRCYRAFNRARERAREREREIESERARGGGKG